MGHSNRGLARVANGTKHSGINWLIFPGFPFMAWVFVQTIVELSEDVFVEVCWHFENLGVELGQGTPLVQR